MWLELIFIWPGRYAAWQSPGFILDRGLFDHGLAQFAALAGAELRCGSRLVGFDGETCRAEGPDGVETLRPRVMVAADGPGSKLRKYCGLPALTNLTGMQYEVPLARALDRARIMFHRNWRHGYAWLFPKGRIANLGLGFRETHPGQARQALNALKSELQAQGVIEPGCLGRSIGAIPVSGPMGPLTVGPRHIYRGCRRLDPSHNRSRPAPGPSFGPGCRAGRRRTAPAEPGP